MMATALVTAFDSKRNSAPVAVVVLRLGGATQGAGAKCAVCPGVTLLLRLKPERTRIHQGLARTAGGPDAEASGRRPTSVEAPPPLGLKLRRNQPASRSVADGASGLGRRDFG